MLIRTPILAIVARKYDIKLQILKAMIGLFLCGICSASVVYYYQQQEINTLVTASKMVKLERGVAKWERQLSRTKLVGNKVAKSQLRYKGELAYLNDLQTSFWQNLSLIEQIKADRTLSNISALSKSVDDVQLSWDRIKKYHEALLVNAPKTARLNKTAYKSYKVAVTSLNQQLVSSVGDYKQMAGFERTLQLIAICLFGVSILLFLVAAVFYYLRDISPALLVKLRLLNDQNRFGYAYALAPVTPTRVPLTTDEYQAYISNFTMAPLPEAQKSVFDEEEVVQPLREVKTKLPEDLEVITVGITTVTDFSTFPEVGAIIEAEVMDNEVEAPAYLGFDQNNTYYATAPPAQPVADMTTYVRADDEYVDYIEQDVLTDQDDLTKEEPFELFSLDANSRAHLHVAANTNDVPTSETWFEFSLPSDLVLNGNHPIWISAVGSKSLGYSLPPATSFAALLELFHPDERFTFLQVLRTHLHDLTGNTPLQMKCRLKQSNGDYIRVDLGGLTERMPDGQPMRLRGYWMSIDDAIGTPSHVPPMSHMRREGFDLEAYTWELPTSFLVQDYDICIWSEGFAKILGYTPHTMPITCQDVRGMIHPEDYLAFMTALNKLLNTSTQVERFTWKLRLRRADGHFALVTMQGVIMNNVLGQPYRFAGVLDHVLDYYDPKAARFQSTVVLVAGSQPTSTYEASHRFIRRSA